MGIKASGLKTPHILRQPKHAMAIGAGEIGLGHQLGAARGVLSRQTAGNQTVFDERANGARRHMRNFGLSHPGHRRGAGCDAPKIAAAWSPRMVARSFSGMSSERTCRTQSIMPMS